MLIYITCHVVPVEDRYTHKATLQLNTIDIHTDMLSYVGVVSTTVVQ